jgi:hypothetical protein
MDIHLCLAGGDRLPAYDDVRPAVELAWASGKLLEKGIQPSEIRVELAAWAGFAPAMPMANASTNTIRVIKAICFSWFLQFWFDQG